MVDQAEATAKQEQADAEAAFNLATSSQGEGEVKPAAEAKPEAPAVEQQAKTTQEQEAADAETAKAEAAAKAAAEAEEVWKGVHPKLRERIEGLDKSLAGVSGIGNEVKRLAGYVSAGQKKVDDALNAIKGTAGAPTESEVAKAATSTEAFKAFEEEYQSMPELVEAVRGMAKVFGAGKPGFDPGEFEKKVSAQVSDGTLKQMGEVVAIKYPEWEKTEKSTEFRTWLQANPALHPLAESERARDAIKVLDTYEAHKKAEADKAKPPAPKQTRRERMEGAAPVRGTTPTYQPTESEQEAAEAEFRRVTNSGA